MGLVLLYNFPTTVIIFFHVLHEQRRYDIAHQGIVAFCNETCPGYRLFGIEPFHNHVSKPSQFSALNTRHDLVSDILAHDPQQNVEWLSNLCEATAKVALAELWESTKECLRKLEVVTAPTKSRAVRAKEHLAVGKV